jgi:O-antigen ligase
MWMLAVLSVALALTGLRHYASGEFLADAAAGRIQGYPSGLAGNPNDLALTLDIIVPLTMALLLCAQRVFDRVVLLGILGLNVAAIVTTFSRGGFVTLATMAVVAVPWIVRRWGAAPLAALAVTALLASTLLPSSYLDRLQTIGDIESDPTGSAQDRWRDTVAAVRLVGEHPVVGSGLGMDFLALNDARGRTWKSVHNAYLNYGVDLGLPGLGLFVALLASAIWSARRIERRPPPFDGGAELATLAGGVRIALVGFAVGAVFYPVAYHLYFYYLAGLAVSLQTIAHHEAAVRV